MITISLDEYGEFEKEDTKPLFIAGIILYAIYCPKVKKND